MTGGGSGPLFHGGVPHLRPGDLVLPPVTTGVAAVDYERRRPDRVYLSEHVEVAAMFAGWQRGRGWQAGALYEVEPVGQLEMDPNGEGDWVMAQVLGCTTGVAVGGSPGGSWTAPAARVVRVLATGVAMTPAVQEAANAADELVGRVRHLNLTDQRSYHLLLHRTDLLQDRGMDLRQALTAALSSLALGAGPGGSRRPAPAGLPSRA